MSYDYATERPNIFTEHGQVMFLSIRDNAKRLLAEAGAARSAEMMRGCAGNVWTMLACIDRLVELGEIRELTPLGAAGQDRVFVAA